MFGISLKLLMHIPTKLKQTVFFYCWHCEFIEAKWVGGSKLLEVRTDLLNILIHVESYRIMPV